LRWRVVVAGLFRFSKKERIHCPQDFRKGMKFGRRSSSKSLTLYALKKKEPSRRLGIVVKKEVGSAPHRNRIKRYCREFFRVHKQGIDASLDIIIFVKKGCSFRRYQDAEKELEKLLTIRHH
jgi:ribonuclease P protein component